MGPCGLCDRCATPHQPDSLPQDDDAAAAKAVLETVTWCGGRFGLSRIVEILRGSRSKALQSFGAGDCPTYGRYRDRSKPAVTGLVKELINSGYLSVEGMEYPTLHVTRTGREALEGIGAPVVAKHEEPPASSSATKRFDKPVKPAAISAAAPADPQLFERLRRLRTELAEEEGVAPFVIFHDKTLRTIASHKPVTSAALREIPGIGDVKVERYGRRVLAVVNGE